MDNNFIESEKSKKIGRRLAREELFKILFQAELLKEDTKDIFEEYLNRNKVIKNKKDLEFIRRYSEGISLHYNDLKDIINKKMENWNFERIGAVERSLLILSVYELLKEDIPHEIVINEAVELGKEYGDTKTYEFINGVLAKIILSK